ncbi:MAG: outer membrane beta-barrel protein [Hyphomonadaceae bacterium]
MKKTILLGLGVLAMPVVAAGAAEAQKKAATRPPPAPAPAQVVAPEPTSYVSLSVAAISGDKYSYMVEDIFRVDGEIGDGYLIEAAYGMKLAPEWRGEIAVSWRDHDNATTNWALGANQIGPGMSAYTLDVLAYRDFAINPRANFYLGGGVGLANVTLDDGMVTDSTASGLQLQAIAGVDAKLNGNVKVFAEVRLRSMHPDVEDGTAGVAGAVHDNFDITSTTVGAGVRFMF